MLLCLQKVTARILCYLYRFELEVWHYLNLFQECHPLQFARAFFFWHNIEVLILSRRNNQTLLCLLLFQSNHYFQRFLSLFLNALFLFKINIVAIIAVSLKIKSYFWKWLVFDERLLSDQIIGNLLILRVVHSQLINHIFEVLQLLQILHFLHFTIPLLSHFQFNLPAIIY